LGREFLTKKEVTDKYSFLDNYYFEHFLIGKKELLVEKNYDLIQCNVASLISKSQYHRIPVDLKNLITMTEEDV